MPEQKPALSPPNHPNQRIYAGLVAGGAAFLLFRTLYMLLVEDALYQLMGWVNALLIAEAVLDLACLLASIRWWMANDRSRSRLPLQLGAAVTMLHAIRVLAYVMGRTGPWVNWDVRPEYSASYRFDWFWVWFAAILSVLSLVAVIVIWRIVRDERSSAEKDQSSKGGRFPE